MYLTAKAMALFWVFAEGVILLCIRWGYLRWRGEGSHQRPLVYGCAAAFALLGIWVLWGEGLLARLLVDHRFVRLYRWGLWNFLCTLWVVLEGCIMVYVVRVYRLLTAATVRRGGWGPAVITVGLFLLFALYETGLGETVIRRGMNEVGIYNASTFYVRICGLLWVAFEWVVAVYGWKTYVLLRGREERIRDAR